MSNDTLTGLFTLAETGPERGVTSPQAAELDPARYSAELAEFDMTEAQKTELLETLWSIMRSFVELGFTGNICEQIFAGFEELPDASAEGVSLTPPTTEERPADGGKDIPV